MRRVGQWAMQARPAARPAARPGPRRGGRSDDIKAAEKAIGTLIRQLGVVLKTKTSNDRSFHDEALAAQAQTRAVCIMGRGASASPTRMQLLASRLRPPD
jgi:hypothetical protein